MLLAVGCGDDDAAEPTTTTTTAGDDGTTTAPPTSSGEPDATSSTTTTTTTTEAPAAEPLTIHVTNDDGVGAPGIGALVDALTARDDLEVVVVAPAENQSGSSDTTSDGAVTWAEATTAGGYPAVAVDGFPADSVNVALGELGILPDLVISGINEGQNVGPLIELSGTVGAARTAARAGYPALAASQGIGEPSDFPTGVAVVLDWFDQVVPALREGQVEPGVSSINVPTCETGTVRGLADVPPATDVEERDIFAADCASTVDAPVDDIDALNHGFASLSVLSF